jgi:hypothetical protein
VVDPTTLSTEERKKISAIIAHYKATGKKKIESTPPKKGSVKNGKKNCI